MSNFWDSSIWGTFLLIGVLLVSMLAANALKKTVPLLQESLIPTSVLGGSILLVIEGIYRLAAGDALFEAELFGGNGTTILEVLTYHCLALGFIASSFKTSKNKLTKKRTFEIFNTGVTTVSTYLLQGIVGLVITMIAAEVMTGFFEAAGVLLPFGFGQGTGQALNYGNIYETEFGFAGGKSFGLSIAALGFLSASIGGVIHLNVLKRKNKLVVADPDQLDFSIEDVHSSDEIPMQESVDKLTIQVSLVAVAYILTYAMMQGLGALLPGMKSVIFGFNFLLGVLSATLMKVAMRVRRKSGMMKKEYTNNFLMTRVSNFFFDLMVVAGVAAIRLDTLKDYWAVLLILALAGLIVTYVYNRVVARKLFPRYSEEQFLMMYGMLTGTASTGIILLREIDGEFKTPASDNMVYQNLPAIVFGFPIMLLATLAPVKPMLTLMIFILFFAAMNVILFRAVIFKKRRIKKLLKQKTV